MCHSAFSLFSFIDQKIIIKTYFLVVGDFSSTELKVFCDPLFVPYGHYCFPTQYVRICNKGQENRSASVSIPVSDSEDC